MKKITYLDYQLFMYLAEGSNEKLDKKISSEKQNGVLFPYSPAHIEEVAASKAHSECHDDLIKRKLDAINTISGGLELFPARGRPTRLITENPQKCYYRVVSTPNDLVHKIEEGRLLKLKNDMEGDPIYDPNVISNINENMFFHDDRIDQALRNYASNFIINYGANDTYSTLKNLKFNQISHDHTLIEIFFEIMFNFLELVRFSPEPTQKYRSRMHDISHAIYASASGKLVTNDRRFYRKAKIVYTHLDIGVGVQQLDEFLA